MSTNATTCRIAFDKDVLAIFLGAPPHEHLIQTVGCFEHHEMTLDGLDKVQYEQIKNYPSVINLTKCQDEILVQIKSAYLTIKVARGVEMFKEHSKKNRESNPN